MKNNKIIPIVLAVLVAVGLAVVLWLVFAGGDGSDAGDSDNDQAFRLEAGQGVYVSYSAAEFDQQSDKRRWLYFHADWCHQCQALDADIRANLGDIPSDVVIFQVDFDNSDELRQLYGVSYQTTIVAVDSAGKGLKSHTAAIDQTLEGVISGLGR